MTNTTKGISRRRVLKGAGVLAGGLHSERRTSQARRPK